MAKKKKYLTSAELIEILMNESDPDDVVMFWDYDHDRVPVTEDDIDASISGYVEINLPKKARLNPLTS
jgi:hypothetical protein